MAYQALYRKWRPDIFDDVIGQDAIIKTLKNQIVSGRIGHAYLFCGTKGTGKTSCAKIFSRAVNCPNAKKNGGNPCNVCDVCTAIKSGAAMSVFEIDAASNNGVDNIRGIREEVEYPPTVGSYKVYIIDEVHMLSQGAFNALLKTLEEPPSYVIFILATTDPERIPATILSRCQRYDFRRIVKKSIEEHLLAILNREGLNCEKEAVSFIASAADGSLRDALSILDQCLSLHEKEILKYDDVLKILGALDTDVYSRLLNACINGDATNALLIVDDVLSRGADVIQLLNGFIWYLRNVLLAGNIKDNPERILDLSTDYLDRAKADYIASGKENLIWFLTSLSELVGRIRFSSQKRVLLEVEILRLATRNEKSGEEGNRKEARSESKEVKEEPKEFREEPKEAVTLSKNSVSKPNKTLIASKSSKQMSDLDILKSNWHEMVRKLHPSNRSLFNSVMVKEEEGSIVMLFKNNMNYRMAAGNKLENGVLRLRELATELLGHEIRLVARVARIDEKFPDKDIVPDKDVITDEDLAKINFPIDIAT